MSGVAAIVQRDGGRPPADDLRRMLDASPHRAPDGTSSWICDGVALGFLAFHTLPEAHVEPQPLVDSSRRLALAFDGRLDNREELCAALELDAADTVSDSRITLEALARWRAEAASRLYGDFAFVAWDGDARRLIAARDHMGIRPLHYHDGGSFVVCATDVVQILSHPRVPRAPDSETAADYLANDESNSPPSLYRDIFRVPPGHVLVIDAHGARLHCYWRPEPRSPIRYRRNEEYAEHCRELLGRSVAARLRSRTTTAALLSGGIDSSSIVATAHRVLRHANAPLPFSVVFPHDPDADERPFVEALCAHCGLEPSCSEPPRMRGEAFHAQGARWLDIPGFPADEWTRPLYVEMERRGCRVALSGGGADFLFSGSIFQYADLLRQFRVLAAVRRFLDDGRGDAMDQSRLGLIKAGAWPLLPVPLKRKLRPLARRVMRIEDHPEWLRTPRRARPPYPEHPRGGSHATEEAVRLAESGGLTVSLHAAERTAVEHAVELRFPYMDVRLVDFALSIPDEQRRQGPYIKFVLRQALGEDLPEAVRHRVSKGDFSRLGVTTFEALGGERFFGELAIAQAGWVDGEGPLRTYRRMRAQLPGGYDVYGAHIPELCAVMLVEIWFRAAFTLQ